MPRPSTPLFHPHLHLHLLLLLYSLTHSLVTADTTEHHSYYQRLQDSLGGAAAGLGCVLLGVLLLAGAERQVVAYEALLGRCQLAVEIVNDPSRVSALNEGKPVFVSGEVHLESASEGVTEWGSKVGGMGNILDSDTGYRCSTRRVAIRLKRRVEMYQWVEHEKKEEKQTTYSYSLEWREHDVSSGGFREVSGHRNPPRSPALQSRTLAHPSPAMVGAYVLSEQQIDMMNNYYACPIPTSSLEGGRASNGQHVERDSCYFSVHTEPQDGYQQSSSSRDIDYLVYNGSVRNPTPGTVRVSYQALVEGGEISTVAVQQQLQSQSRGRGAPPFRPFLQSDAQAMEPWFLTAIFRVMSGDCSCQRSAHSGANYELDPRDGGRGDGGGSSMCCLPCKVCCCCCSVLSSCADFLSKAIVGDSVLLLQERMTTVGSLFRDERSQLGWRILFTRLGGCLLLSLGFYLIFNPIAVVLSFIPYVSGLLSKLFWVVALLLGFTCGAFIIAVSWIFYRPLYFGGKREESIPY